MSSSQKKTTEPISDEIRGLIKSGKAFKFNGEPICKAYEEDGEYFVEAIGSSDQEDLVGDVMTANALQIMEREFVGKTVFMNHRTMVPDDVFGSIVETKLLKKDGKQLLWFKIVVENENDAAMKSYRVISGGRVKLGTSVTILVKSKKPNPNRKGGIIIDDVESLELSIVGISCNRESQNIWATASKALQLAMKNEISAEEPLIEGDTEMNKETLETAEKSENIETTEIEKTVQTEESNPPVAVVIGVGDVNVANILARSLAAMGRVEVLNQQIAKGETIEERPMPITKGLFNEILEQEPTFWELCDILCEVKWELIWQKNRLAYLGQTDFSNILSAWDETLDEFKAAQTSSFKYWGEFDTVVAETISNALQIEKSLKSLLEVQTSDEEVQKQLHETGIRILAVAKKLNLVEESVTELIPTDEQIQKSGVYQALKNKSEQEIADLSKKLEESEQNYEIAKAGLTVANEALRSGLREPLVTAQGTSATS